MSTSSDTFSQVSTTADSDVAAASPGTYSAKSTMPVGAGKANPCAERPTRMETERRMRMLGVHSGAKYMPSIRAFRAAIGERPRTDVLEYMPMDSRSMLVPKAPSACRTTFSSAWRGGACMAVGNLEAGMPCVGRSVRGSSPPSVG